MTEPKGKRTVRRNRYGKLVGYISGRIWQDLNGQGRTPYSKAEEKAAAAWLAGREDWQDAAWED
jgi:hypothetical protein